MAGGTGLAMLRNLVDAEKTNPFAILPPQLSEDPVKAFEQCLLCFTGNGESTLDLTRKSVNGKTLDEAYRMNISRRWLSSPQWKDMMLQWNNAMTELSKIDGENTAILQTKIAEINEEPTIERVKNLQRCINMLAEDNPTGQDGILGPHTTQAILTFIETCKATYNIQAESSDSNESDVQEGANTAAMQDGAEASAPQPSDENPE